MKVGSFITHIFIGVVALCFLTSVEAASSPVWALTPLTATTLAVPSNNTAIVQYLVENQSTIVRRLSMQPIPGVTQLTTGLGVCGRSFALTGKASCTLSLQIDGSLLTRPIMDGPLVCENGSEFLCYRPASDNVLRITQAPLPETGVSPATGAASGGTGVTLTGVDLTGATDVTFGGVAATSVYVVDSTTVTAVTPAHAVGAVDVVITTPSGLETYTDGYTYETTVVGQSAYGGKIACLNGGLNNLIAATQDYHIFIDWGGYNIPTNATSTTDGAMNTTTIVNTLGAGVYAAQLCNDYAVDSQGKAPCELGNTCYNDWFLPAGNNTTLSGQLNCLYTNKTAIGGLSGYIYWSSTEITPGDAAIQYFFTGVEDKYNKTGEERVRCVRAFTP